MPGDYCQQETPCQPMSLRCIGGLHGRPNQEVTLSKDIWAHSKCCWRVKIYLVLFDDGAEKECPSAELRVEKVITSQLPDVLMPVLSNTVEAPEVQDAEEEVVDQIILPRYIHTSTSSIQEQP